MLRYILAFGLLAPVATIAGCGPESADDSGPSDARWIPMRHPVADEGGPTRVVTMSVTGMT
jgi:hypothetical protein